MGTEGKDDQIYGFRVPHIFELEKTELAEVRNGAVGGLDGDYDLHEAHVLGSKVIHRRQIVEQLHRSTNRSRRCGIKESREGGREGGRDRKRNSARGSSDLERGASLSPGSIRNRHWTRKVPISFGGQRVLLGGAEPSSSGEEARDMRIQEYPHPLPK